MKFEFSRDADYLSLWLWPEEAWGEKFLLLRAGRQRHGQSLGFTVMLDSREGENHFALWLPFFSLTARCRGDHKKTPRGWELRVVKNSSFLALIWNFGEAPDGDRVYGPGAPRYRNGFLNLGDWFADRVLGPVTFSQKEVGSVSAIMDLPEGPYQITIKSLESSWKRKRWFANKQLRHRIEPDVPVPLPGKGENGFDCDEDAIYLMTMPAQSPMEALEKFQADVLYRREKYGGRDWRPGNR